MKLKLHLRIGDTSYIPLIYLSLAYSIFLPCTVLSGAASLPSVLLLNVQSIAVKFIPTSALGKAMTSLQYIAVSGAIHMKET